jgi:DNA-binding IclR family transcriptional regulator
MADILSGVGVLDKAARILDAVMAGPASLSELVEATGLARPTAHRLACALEVHRLVARDVAGRFVLGERFAGSRALDVAAAARPALVALRDRTGESAQAYVRSGDERVCVASAERPSGLRDTVPVGARLSLAAGSGAQVLVAWRPADEVAKLVRSAAFDARTLALVRRRGWAESVAQREPGVGSVSAPVRVGNDVVAAVSVSGPVERLGRSPGRRLSAYVLEAAAATEGALSGI